MVGAKLTKVQCKHMQKCHNEFPPVQLIGRKKKQSLVYADMLLGGNKYVLN
jgi:hypothetical protein